MEKDILKGKWLQVKNDVRSWWSRLTEEDVEHIQGDAERFIEKLKERYGYAHEQAEKEISDFLRMPDSRRQRTA